RVVTPFSQVYSMKKIRENPINQGHLRSIPSYFVGVYLPTARREAGAPTPQLSPSSVVKKVPELVLELPSKCRSWSPGSTEPQLWRKQVSLLLELELQLPSSAPAL